MSKDWSARSRAPHFRNKLIASLTVASMALGIAAVPLSGSAGASSQTKLTFWFWGESDIPGITTWLNQRVALYEKANPNVKVAVVPQSNSTIITSFSLAAQGKTGPDMDTQWATLPTLQPALQGSVTPISNYVPASETKHWLNVNENSYKGQIYAMPLYLLGVPLVWNKQLFKKAGLDPNKAPTTWTAFLADCKALKAHGITPFGMGNQDGYFGAWMFAIYEKQQLNTISQLSQGVATTGAKRTALLKSLTAMYTMFQGLIKAGYVNSNVESLSLNQGWQLFPQKKAAMSFTTDGNVLAWAKTLGAQNVGVGRPPIWGTGKLASTYDATQSSDEFITSWSTNKAATAKFLAFLHTPANMMALYAETGAFPADDRFPLSRVTGTLPKLLDGLDTSGKSVWLENYIPPQIDTNADLPAGQLITSGSGTPAQAAQLWMQQIEKWQLQQPVQFQLFKKLASAS